MKKQFKLGSRVKSKTGGPSMTVIKYEMHSSDHKGNMQETTEKIPAFVTVTWYEEGKWKSGKFDPGQLTSIE